METTRLRRIYVWELPVRIFHWVNALCIFVLAVTGYLIGNPPAIMSGEEASFSYWFGINRFIHFTAAYIFLFALVMRFYWAFAGNKQANWRNFLPVNWGFFQRIMKVLKIDILLMKGEEYLAVGHNALAGLSYFGFFFLTLVMIFTGFGLYADTSTWWFPKLFAWMPALFGGDYPLREIHHATMWLFAAFTIIHLYLVLYHDQFEGRGETSSMISGYKFMEEEIFEKKEKPETLGTVNK